MSDKSDKSGKNYKANNNTPQEGRKLRGNAAGSSHAFGGTRPMFQCQYDINGVAFDHNAHPELEYEHNERLRTGEYGYGDERVPMSQHCFDQVFSRSGTGRGSMTFTSNLKDSKR